MTGIVSFFARLRQKRGPDAASIDQPQPPPVVPPAAPGPSPAAATPTPAQAPSGAEAAGAEVSASRGGAADPLPAEPIGSPPIPPAPIVAAPSLPPPEPDEAASPAAVVPDMAILLANDARTAEARGDWPVAAERWRAVAAAAPDSPEGLLGQAVALQRLGQASQAEAILTEIIKRFPGQASALHDLGRLAEQRSDWPAAERWWRGFNAIYDGNWWSHAALAASLSHQGRPEEAEATLRAAMAQFPQEPSLFAEEARSAQGRGDYAAALQSWDGIIARFPADWIGYGGRVGALAAMGRQAEADEALLAYGALLPDDTSALHDLARRAERLQDWPAAEAAWRRFLVHEQRLDWGYLGLVHALARQDRLAEAAEMLAEAQQRHPGSARLATEAAGMAEARGHHAEALSHWRTVSRLAPTSPAGAVGEANALTRTGNSAGADAALVAAMARLPDEASLHAAYAEAAVARADWPQALARLRAAQRRFPSVPTFSERIVEIEGRAA